ncbi:MAG: Gfo/Idh/MocA family protein [Armatimonadota bacterium]
MISEIGRSAADALAYVNTIPPRQGDTMIGVPFEKRDVVRLGFVGVGGRGFGQLHEMLAVEGARITAVCDVSEESMLRAKEAVGKVGQPTPAVEQDWHKVCERDDVDMVYICSPWDVHVPVAVYAMECGKHAAVEVPAANTLADCWLMVDTSERTRKHCVILENCCYEYNEMLVMNMIREGLFGTLTHAEAAYIHDLRALLLADEGEGLWRRKPHISKDGNLYPTHGLGPVAWYMNINRGDVFTRMVSMSSLSASLAEYRDRTLPPDDPRREEIYKCGDMNTSLIQTALGRTIMLQHDVVTPRPYSRINLVQGTKGTFCDWPPRIFFDGQDVHDWKSIDSLKEQYEHPLWREQGKLARELGGHGGMDFIMNYRLIQLYRQGLPPDADVYDAAAWSAPGPLSFISVAWDNMSLPFPDFTRGNWEQPDHRPEL